MSHTIIIDSNQSYTRVACVGGCGVLSFAVQANKEAFNLDDVFLGRVVQKDESFFWVNIGTKAPLALPREHNKTLNDGDLILVQIVRLPMVDHAAPHGMKGARLSTNLHFVGRFCVFHPFKNNISKNLALAAFLRKNTSLRDTGKLLDENQLSLIANEVEQLQVLYQNCLNQKDIGLCWRAPTAIGRLLRDAPISSEVVFDNEVVFAQYKNQLKGKDHLTHRVANLHERPVFRCFGVEEAWDAIIPPNIPLLHNGSVYIEEGVCATTIDVNSGGGEKHQQNLHAAAVICQHIALRVLSGPIVIDFARVSSDYERKKIIQIMNEQFQKWKINNIKILGWTNLGHLELLRSCYANSIPMQITQNFE